MDLNKAIVILLANKNYSTQLKRRLFKENSAPLVTSVVELSKNIVSNSSIVNRVSGTSVSFVNRNKLLLKKLANPALLVQTKTRLLKNNFLIILALLNKFGSLYIENHNA